MSASNVEHVDILHSLYFMLRYHGAAKRYKQAVEVCVLVCVGWGRGGCGGANLMEKRLVVVDVVDADDHLGGATEWERTSGGVVVCGCDVEDVLRPT